MSEGSGRWFICCVVFLIVTAWVCQPDHAFAAEQKFKSEQFIDPETCGGCHDEIMTQWQGSMHSFSHDDPVYTRVAKFLRQGLTHKGEIQEADACVKCHTPVGYATGFPDKLSDDLSKTSPVAARGIQCDYCHSAVDVSRMYNKRPCPLPGAGRR